MLKQAVGHGGHSALPQPPSGGCVLKPTRLPAFRGRILQPPSGGCVLKPAGKCQIKLVNVPAAFRRLCVETSKLVRVYEKGRPAAFRRLCVETLPISPFDFAVRASRLQAAVC